MSALAADVQQLNYRYPGDAALTLVDMTWEIDEGAFALLMVVLALPMRPGVSSLNLATATAAALYRRR